eukprot:SAG31_NODE_4966_length_2829_cov_4.529304_6_plen_236_part_00
MMAAGTTVRVVLLVVACASCCVVGDDGWSVLAARDGRERRGSSGNTESSTITTAPLQLSNNLSVTASALTWAVLLEWPPVQDGSAYAETTYQVERGPHASSMRVYAQNVPGVDRNTSQTFASFDPPVKLRSHFVDTQAVPGQRYVHRVSEKLNGSLTGVHSGFVEGVAAEAGVRGERLRRFPRGGAPRGRMSPPPRSRLGMWDLISIGDHHCPAEAEHAGITDSSCVEQGGGLDF